MTKNKPDYMRTKAQAENEMAIKIDTAKITVEAYNILRMLNTSLDAETIAAIVVAACGQEPFKYASVIRHG